jgi:hypothetical protein
MGNVVILVYHGHKLTDPHVHKIMSKTEGGI